MADVLKEALTRPAQKLGRMASGAAPLNEAERDYLWRRKHLWVERYDKDTGAEVWNELQVRRDWLCTLAFNHRLIPAPFARDVEVRALLTAMEPRWFPPRFRQHRKGKWRGDVDLLAERPYREAMAILGDVEGLDMLVVRVGGKLVPVICSAARAADLSEIEVVGHLCGREMEAGEAARFEEVNGVWVQ